MQEDKLKSFLEGIGAMGESLFVFYSSMINAGFDEGKALALTIAFLNSVIALGSDKGGEK